MVWTTPDTDTSRSDECAQIPGSRKVYPEFSSLLDITYYTYTHILLTKCLGYLAFSRASVPAPAIDPPHSGPYRRAASSRPSPLLRTLQSASTFWTSPLRCSLRTICRATLLNLRLRHSTFFLGSFCKN